MHWDIARDTRRGYIHKLLVLAEVAVDTLADSKLIEMVSVPSENLEDYAAELFEGSLVGDFEVAMPAGKEISRLYWERVNPLSRIFDAQGVALLCALNPARHDETYAVRSRLQKPS